MLSKSKLKLEEAKIKNLYIRLKCFSLIFNNLNLLYLYYVRVTIYKSLN